MNFTINKQSEIKEITIYKQIYQLKNFFSFIYSMKFKKIFNEFLTLLSH